MRAKFVREIAALSAEFVPAAADEAILLAAAVLHALLLLLQAKA